MTFEWAGSPLELSSVESCWTEVVMSRSSKQRIHAAVLALALCAAGRAVALEPVLVKNLDLSGSSSSPCAFGSLSASVQLFAATNGLGRELWRTDGTYLGTSLVKDIRNPGSSNPFGFVPFSSPSLGDIVLFTANDGSGQELWRSDGTLAGTQRVADINPGSGGSNPSYLNVVPAVGKVYFKAFDGVTTDIWETDGATATKYVDFLAVDWVVARGLELYFGGEDPDTPVGNELWRMPVVGGSPTLVADIEPGVDGSYPSQITNVGGTLYINAYTSATGREPYVSDGATVTPLGDLTTTGDGSTHPAYFTALGSWVYFTGTPGLMRTDGTAANTSVVLAGGEGPLVVAGSKLYFAAFTGGAGLEPYVTDGSAVGIVEDVRPGSASSLIPPWQAAAIGGVLVFRADDGTHGVEAWQSVDGTAGGTDVIDLEPGAAGSDAACFADVGPYGLMGASYSPLGNELFALVATAHDFGDAPDSYGTRLADDGARHTIVDGFYLGGSVDGELERAYDQEAQSDDWEWTDDEDGVTFPLHWLSFGLLGLGETVTIGVTASQAGMLDAWIDYNGDGDFGDAGEKVTFTDGGGAALAAGANAKTFVVPGSAVAGVTFARFRFTSAGIASPIGLASDGEVEDYWVRLAELDFGDAVDASYATLRASDGARHAIVDLQLGTSVDADADGQPSSDASGDDTDGNDDEDGVVVPVLPPGGTVMVQVEVGTLGDAPEGGGGPGSLNAWIDYDQDGDWDDAGEQAFQDVAMSTGTNLLQLDVPVGATLGATVARFRLSTATGLAPTGLAPDGEVEDHAVLIAVQQADLTISKTDGQSTAVPGEQVVYTIVAANPSGPSDAPDSVVSDAFPAELVDCDVQCTPSGGATCGGMPLRGTSLDETLDLPVGGAATFVVTCTIDPGASGSLFNTATVTPPAGLTDPTPANNSATDADTLVPTGDLAISKTDDLPFVVPPATLTYTILVDNPGPSDVLGVDVDDTFPTEVANVAWTCVGSGGGSCAVSGSGDIAEAVDLPAGGAVTFTAAADAVATPPDIISNTATLTPPIGFTDPNPVNDAATAVTQVVDGPDIFADGFESGDTSAWDAAIGGPTGVLALDGASDAVDLTVRVDAEALERTGRRRAKVLSGQGADGGVLFRLDLETRDGRFRFVARLADASDGWAVQRSPWLDRVPPTIELGWRRSLHGAADGALSLTDGDAPLCRVDGVATPPASLRRIQGHLARGRALVRRILHPGWRPSGGEAGSP
jgi:uncharacterized repeat protein (TIGR01451 family)